MALSLDMRFTEPALPLFIDAEGDAFECLFVLSTNQVAGATQSTNQTQASVTSNNRKRGPDDSTHETPRLKRPMKAVQSAPSSTAKSTTSSGTSRDQSRPPDSMLPPPSVGPSNPFSQPPLAVSTYRNMPPPPVPAKARSQIENQDPLPDEEPLFLPCSQLSQQELDILRSTGLGIESMNEQELTDMLEGEGEEVDFSQPQPSQGYVDLGNRMDVDQLGGDQDSFDLVDEFGATQSSEAQAKVGVFVSVVVGWQSESWVLSLRASNRCLRIEELEKANCAGKNGVHC